jgi:hypothetical protein
VGRERSVAALDQAMAGNREILLAYFDKTSMISIFKSELK